MNVGTSISRVACVLSGLLALSCAESGSLSVDAQWNLTCPAASAVGCGSLATETCLGNLGQRAIVGASGDAACTGEPIIVSCEVIERPSGGRAVFLEASVDGSDENLTADFAFELRGATISEDGAVTGSGCNVTIVEDGLAYDVGGCGDDAPSMEQPCQLSNISIDGGEVVFDLECVSLLSSTTENGFDVGAVGGGPTTIRFSDCTGF